jgi:hypothetical protein
MRTNYFLVNVDPGGIHEDWQVVEILMGTQHFTGGKKTFTFVIPIGELFRACIYNYQNEDWHIRIDGTTINLTLEQFNNNVIYDCDVVHYEKETLNG